MSGLAVDAARRELGNLLGSDFSQPSDRAKFLSEIFGRDSHSTERSVQVALPLPKRGFQERIRDAMHFPLERLVETVHRIEIAETKRAADRPGYIISGPGDFKLEIEGPRGWKMRADVSFDGQLQSVTMGRRFMRKIDLNFESGLRVNQAIGRILERANESGTVVEI